jgi:hypothetical protein
MLVKFEVVQGMEHIPISVLSQGADRHWGIQAF